MFKENTYVRCPIDDDKENPRYFALGKIKKIDDFAETVQVDFYDITGISEFYQKPPITTFSFTQITHVRINNGSKVAVKGKKMTVKAGFIDKESDLYYYYLLSDDNCVSKYYETDIVATFNDGYISPYLQLLNYEFQNPQWFLGRGIVSRTMQVINNSLYGFKELAGCKISLKPYQLKTVMRCLQGSSCRNMIADEVGLGKTIEALAVLKIYLHDHKDKQVSIIVPDALLEQWRTELAFKFKLFEGLNENGNNISLYSISDIRKVALDTSCDFVIVDEVHNLINDDALFELVLDISKNTENILMLSATPIQKREEEYQKLLTLIQPEKYEKMPQEEFNDLLNLQNSIIRKVHASLECLDTLEDSIEDSKNEHSDDTEDAYNDLYESLEEIKDTISNEAFDTMFSGFNYEASDFSVPAIQTALAYVCEHYQLEKAIVRNRRAVLDEESVNKRDLVDISYNIQTEFNTTEYLIFKNLGEWFESLELEAEEFDAHYKPLISSFFSSAHAFRFALSQIGKIIVPSELMNLAEKWEEEENGIVKAINSYLDDPTDYQCRLINIVDFIDQETDGDKVLLFTDHQETFSLYQSILTQYFGGEKCCFFSKDMSPDDLELNAYRFQNNEDCNIMLSDESGGEGRNFQHADYVVHIDVPWCANDLEQRIGRLDRVGRSSNKPVISVVAYAQQSLEEDLFKFWDSGLNIFKKSQSGLEIIMNDLDKQITHAVCDDFRYGLNNIIDKILQDVEELKQVVKRERYFDLAGYQYQTINQLLEKNVELYSNNETTLFSSAMMGWASLSGFKGDRQGENKIRFNETSFSINSAKNSMFIPPDMKSIIDGKLNQLQNRVRLLNNERISETSTKYILGTFDRQDAISNDYIHFFAPGDEIFDSIVSNAIVSYKGTCSAFEIPLLPFNWMGFVYVWEVDPDDSLLYRKGIPPHIIDQYRGFLPGDQFISVEPIIESSATDEMVIKAYKDAQKYSRDTKYDHLGQRHGNPSNIELFREKFPTERWERFVKVSYKKSHEKITKKIQLKVDAQIELLKRELSNSVSAQKAMAQYYHTEDSSEELLQINDVIIKAFSKPKITLDSACFVVIRK